MEYNHKITKQQQTKNTDLVSMEQSTEATAPQSESSMDITNYFGILDTQEDESAQSSSTKKQILNTNTHKITSINKPSAQQQQKQQQQQQQKHQLSQKQQQQIVQSQPKNQQHQILQPQPTKQ